MGSSCYQSPFGGCARMPSSFLPAEDQGYFITNIMLPVGATQERTDKVLKEVEEYFQREVLPRGG